MMSVISLVLAVGTVAPGARACNSELAVQPYIPYEYRIGGVSNAVADIRAIRSRTGLKRFYLCGPGVTTVGCGPFASDLYARMGAEMAEVKHQLSESDVEVGWWCTTSIRYWSNLPKVVDAWGNRSADHKHCPLSPEF